MRRFYLLLTLVVMPSVSQELRSEEFPFAGEIIYLSSDLANVAVFSKERTRFGPTDLTILNPEWPAVSARYFETSNHIQCLSVGFRQTSDEYAIKRPIKDGEKYRCLKTAFRVARCFDECDAAIIEIKRPLSGDRKGVLKSYMYVDSCRGVIIFSTLRDLTKGIPLDAEWLRGEVGILASPDFPKCRSF